MVGLEGLDSRQIEAVMHRYGPIRVIAGPGAGKTRVLTHRIACLSSYYGVRPENILAVTFTGKAAREMKERVDNLLGDISNRVHISTFHSLGLSILRAEAPRFEVLDEGRKLNFIRELLGPKNLNLDIAPGLVAANISRWKAEMLRPKDLYGLPEDQLSEAAKVQWTGIYLAYENARTRHDMLDYDDLLLSAYHLFISHPSVLERYQSRFLYVLVDEFHDINRIQWELTGLLAAPQNNLMVIFDEDQNIYSWRGAKPDYCLNFNRYFPGAPTVHLDKNYRSVGSIVQTASRLITNNSQRTNKSLWTDNPPGSPVKTLPADNPYHEAALIIQEIRSLLEDGIKPKDIAILYRTNAQSRILEDELIRCRIPYVVVGSLGFYDRREIKDMIAFLRLVNDPHDDEALLRVINVPNRYLGKAFINELRFNAQARNTSLFDQLGAWDFSRPYMVNNSQEFKDIILALHARRHHPLANIIRDIRTVFNYDRYIVDDEEPSPDDSRIQNLEELCDAALQFSSLPDFLYYIEQISRQRDQSGDAGDAVSLMTIHKVKGVEFGAVFVAGCCQGLLPHYRALEDGNTLSLEEERRICYVAVTRAKERLYLSYPEWYRGRKMDPSIFWEEMEMPVD